VSIVTGYGLDGREIGFNFRQWQEMFLSSTASRPGLGSTQPTIERVRGAISPRVKRQQREDDHSFPATAVVKNVVAITPLPTHLYDVILN
jgi:hypothetical protein